MGKMKLENIKKFFTIERILIILLSIFLLGMLVFTRNQESNKKVEQEKIETQLRDNQEKLFSKMKKRPIKIEVVENDKGQQLIYEYKDKQLKVEDFKLYSYNVNVFITFQDGTTMDLKEALENNVTEMKDLVGLLEEDYRTGVSSADMLKDGGTVVFKYSTFYIYKYEQSNNNGSKDMYFSTVENPLEKINKK